MPVFGPISRRDLIAYLRQESALMARIPEADIHTWQKIGLK